MKRTRNFILFFLLFLFLIIKFSNNTVEANITNQHYIKQERTNLIKLNRNKIYFDFNKNEDEIQLIKFSLLN